MQKQGVTLVSLQGINKGQTVDILDKTSDISVHIRPHGSKKTYSYPIKYIMDPLTDYEFPRNQETYQIWYYGK